MCENFLLYEYGRRLRSMDQSIDDAAAEASLAVIQHHGLSRRDRALGLSEHDRVIAVVVQAHRAGLVGLAVTGLGKTGERQGRGLSGDPVEVTRRQAAAEEKRVVVSLHDDQGIAREVLVGHVPRRFLGVAATADAEPLALAVRVMHQALLSAQQFAVGAADVAGPRRQIARQKAAEIAFADEADAGTVFFRRIGEAGLGGDAAHLGFLKLSKWKQRARQLRLVERVFSVSFFLLSLLSICSV